LIRRDALSVKYVSDHFDTAPRVHSLVLDLGLYVVNGVRRFHFQGNGLSSEAEMILSEVHEAVCAALTSSQKSAYLPEDGGLGVR
jgi:hypothetical protein